MHIYEQLGVTRVINAYECLTRLGGSLMAPEVLEAMNEAGQWFIHLDELQAKAGQRIAELIGVEGAYITSGAAAGLAISAAACMAGADLAKIARLPETESPGASPIPNEIVIEHSHRNRYDGAMKLAGAKFVEFGYPGSAHAWELEDAITSRTAAVAYFVTNTTPATLPLSTLVEVAHRRGVPVIVDAAAELPPASNLRKFIGQGADLVVFSGGKGLRGPQSTGLILGRKDLIAACAANSNPFHTVGRPMKVGKEEMVGLMVAVELFLKEPDASRQACWEEDVQYAVNALRQLPGLEPERVFPMPTGKTVPRVIVKVTDQSPVPAPDIAAALLQGNPCIELRADPQSFTIQPQNLQSGEIELICRRIKEIVDG